MGKIFRQLSYADRQTIEAKLLAGVHKREIAEMLGLSLSGLYRELSRMTADAPYCAEAAQADFETKRCNKRLPNSLSRFPGLDEFIAAQILNHGRSPSAITRYINSGFTAFPPGSISVSTIYNLIHAGAIPGVTTQLLQRREDDSA